MPEAYSLDLRELVARFVEGGRSCRAAAALFSVSVACQADEVFSRDGKARPQAERRTPPRQA